MSKLEIEDITIDHLFRSRRKTLSIEINDRGQLIVRAPTYAPQREIFRLLILRRNWIKKRQNTCKETSRLVKKYFVEGENFLFLGSNYPLTFVESGRLKITDRFELGEKYRDSAKIHFEKWYKTQLKGVVLSFVQEYCVRFHLRYRAIKINSAKTRWASCSTTGNLNFSWRLAMAPREVIEYVVVHELSHLIHKNHAKKFWQTVEAMLPTYKEKREWLKTNGSLLRI